MNEKIIDRYQVLAIIVFIVLAIIASKFDDEKRIDQQFLSDKYTSRIKLEVVAEYTLPEEGTYTSRQLNQTSISTFDNLTRNVYIFDMEKNIAEKRADWSDFGLGYRFNGYIYQLYDKYMVIWDGEYNKIVSEKLFKDQVYSSVFIDNIGIVSLYRNAGIHAVNLDTQEIIWSIEEDELISNHMKLSIENNVLIYLANGRIHGISPYTGDTLYCVEGDYYPPYLIDDNYIYTSGRSKMKCIDMDTWEIISEADARPYSMTIDDSALYVVDLEGDNYIEKFSKVNLDFQWKTEIYDSVGWITRLTEGYVVIKNHIGEIAILNKENGSVDWVEKFDSGDNFFGYKEYLIVIDNNGLYRYFDTSQ